MSGFLIHPDGKRTNTFLALIAGLISLRAADGPYHALDSGMSICLAKRVRKKLVAETLEKRILLAADLAYGPHPLSLSDIALQENEVRLLKPMASLEEFRFEIPDNVRAADTTNTDQIQPGGISGLDLDGSGLTVGVWEAGSGYVRGTHEAFGNRVSIGDSGGSTASHATHVAGTIAASGAFNSNAQGMAPGANIISYTSGNANSEMRAAAQGNQIQVSNHSYSLISGWWIGDVDRFGLSGGVADVWWGDRFLQSTEDADFGKYSNATRDLDAVIADNPELLSVWSAGNDRNDVFSNRRGNSTYVTYLSGDPGGVSGYGGEGWYLVNDSGNTTAPGGDGNGGTGYDTLSQAQNAKNTVVVGSIGDITSDPYTSSQISTSGFSSYGPSDDGRIKPDLVGNGSSLLSTESAGNSAYGNKSGTSMSAPNVAGTAVLLIEHFEDEFSIRPQAATTKGVMIHTAFDAGAPGPDYAHGWGLVDAAAAASHITEANSNTSGRSIEELTFAGTEITKSVSVDGSEALKVTIVWTDPEGNPQGSALDDRTSVLVNDLDLSITDESGTTYYPWSLNPVDPAAAATRTAANRVDNVEQVLIDAPAAGDYTIRISATGNVNAQDFSLLVSGAAETPTQSGIRILAGTGGGLPNSFSLIELTTSPVGESVIGPASFNTGLDVDPTTGILYGASSSLRTIDVETGATTTIGSIGNSSQPSILVRSIAFASDGTLYAVADNEFDQLSLFTISKTNGLASEVGPLESNVWGIDFAPDGTLFGAAFDLFTIDPATADILTTVDLNDFIVEIDYSADGTIYGVVDDGNDLVSIDPGTGALTVLGSYASDLQSVATIGEPDSGSLSGVKWEDIDGDGVKDADEPLLAGWTIYLDENDNRVLDPDEVFTVTDDQGRYEFTGLPAGDFTIAEVQQTGWIQTYPFVPEDDGTSAPEVLSNAANVAGAGTGIEYDEWTPSPNAGGGNAAESTQLISLDQFRADPRFSSIDGSGFAIAVLDSGIDLDHPFFGPDSNFDGVADRIVYNEDFTVEGDPDADDVHGHGTNVTGIIAGLDPSGNETGVAPGVDIVALQVLNDSNGFPNLTPIENALQWVIANAATYNIGAVNMSLGTFANYASPVDLGLGDEFAALRAMDIMIVSSAGNDFSPSNSQQNLGYPAADALSLAVGAVWDGDNGGPFNWGAGGTDNTTGPDRIISFSQRSESMSDIFAPGGAITSAGVGGGLSTYFGTSQAAPHVSGIALLAQQLATERLGRRLTSDEFRTLMRDSSVTINDGDDEDDNVINTGLDFLRVDMFALGEAIWSLGGSVTPGNGVWHVTLNAGDAVEDLDFGNQFRVGESEIRGVKYFDANGDGVRNPEENGIPGWTIFLDENGNGELDAGEVSTVTDADGNYAFTELLEGEYVVAEVQQTDWKQTSPINDTFLSPFVIDVDAAGPEVTLTGEVGDHPSLDPGLDVDMYRVELVSGQRLLIDVDTDPATSNLDSVLTVFAPNGEIVGVSDDDVASGEAASSDSYIDITAVGEGTYFFGISGYSNFNYDPLIPGSGTPSKYVGGYDLVVQILAAAPNSEPASEATESYDVASDVAPFSVAIPTNEVAAEFELIVNGDFETGDLGGWTMSDSTGNGSWIANNGTIDPEGNKNATAPISGQYDAMSRQSGLGIRRLSQPFTVPAQLTSATLSWLDRIENQTGSFVDPDQEFRVQIQDSQGTLVGELFSTNPNDNLIQVGPNLRSFDVTALLADRTGQTLQLVFEEQDTNGFFNVTLDDISLNLESELQLASNPGDGVWYVTVGDDDLADQLDFGNHFDPDRGFSIFETADETVVHESGTMDQFSVVLDQAPTTNVVLELVSQDTGEVLVAPQQLTFTIGNWSLPQQVSVIGVDDPDADGNQMTDLVISVNDALSDDTFDGFGDQTIRVTTIDDDLDLAAPVFESIARHAPFNATTSVDVLVFRLQFNETIQNIDASDFLIDGTTTAQATELAAVQGTSETIFQLTVQGGDLDQFNGPVGLNLNPAHDIVDIAGNLLPSSEPETDEDYVLDNLAPIAQDVVIADGGHSIVDEVLIRFDSEVNIDVNAFDLRNAAGEVVGVQTTLGVDDGNSTATLRFSGALIHPGGSLSDGDYTLKILDDHIRDLAGNSLDGNANGSPGGERVDQFFRFFGDSDGDRDVDGQDYGRFGLSFLKSSSDQQYDSAFDFDRDGDVDGQDYGQFGLRFLTSLP